MPTRILVHIEWPVRAWSIPDAKFDELKRRFPKIDFVRAHTRNEAGELIDDVDICFTPFLNAEWIPKAQKLRWVHSSAAAVEGLLPLRELAARDIVVTNSRGVQAIAMAEHVIGGLLVLSRKFNRLLDAQRERQWIQNDLTEDWPWLLHGKQMTVVGLGTIGLEVAQRAHAFGMKVTGVRRRVEEKRPRFVDRVLSPEQIDDAVDGCDVLVLAAPGVSATKEMIQESHIARLNPGAIVVNVARGAVIDESALIRALETRRLGGAVLDVFNTEPLPVDSPFWSLPNVLVSPHSSGFRATHWDDVLDLFTDNLRRWLRGKPLRNLVDPAAGY
jgi:phosphoglycerate dehydrogenase-like enzyme